MKHTLYALLFVLCFALTGCGTDKDSRSWEVTDYESLEDIVYVKEVEEDASGIVQTYQIRYRSDNCEVISYLSIPQECLKQKEAYPCLIYNRGGNRDFGATNPKTNAAWAETFNMVVFSSQYRGTAGGTGMDEYGGDDVHDVIKLIDFCEAFPFVDMERLYMIGVSRGGMMTYRAISEDSRIKKAVVVSGLADTFMSYEERPDLQGLYQLLVGGTPQKLPEEFEKRSATYWADSLQCPVLIIHSKQDEKVSYAQAEKMVQKLEEAGMEYQFVSYDDSTHGLHEEDLAIISDWLR